MREWESEEDEMITVNCHEINVHSRLSLMGLHVHDKATGPEHKTRIEAVEFSFLK